MVRTDALYFLALIPPPDILNYIHSIKLYVAEKYHCKHALKSPPHITIEPPFAYPLQKENYLCEKIKTLNNQQIPNNIPVELHNYDVFLPKVVFINVVQNDVLTKVYNTTHTYVKTQLNIVKDLPQRPFHPHITIAFRDVKKQLVPNILQDVQENFPIHTQFAVNHLSLLKHNGQQWDIIL